MRDNSQRGRRDRRLVDQVLAPLRSLVESLIEFVRVETYSTGADVVGSATSDEGERLTIVEPYGVASRPPGAATGIVLAPGGDTSGKLLVGSVSPSGRPATAAGDTMLWTVGGHQIKLENDGSLTIISKDGQTIELTETGDIVHTVSGESKVKLGGPGTTLGVARLTDTVAKDTEMAAWMVTAQPLLVAIAGLAGLPAPVFPTDFGVINSASDTTESL